VIEFLLHTREDRIVMEWWRTTMHHRLAACASLVAVLGFAQSPAPPSEPSQFEAASIHRIDPKEGSGPSDCTTSPGLVRCTNVTLKRCIVGAYAVLPDQVPGGPDWIDVDRFQITGRSTQPLGDKGLMAMLQTLLADRFKLVLHRELRPGETMVLEVAKNGPKLEPAGNVRHSWENMHDYLAASKMTMGEFAEILSRNLNLPVVDRTGLTGTFNFTLHWTPTRPTRSHAMKLWLHSDRKCPPRSPSSWV
jgi:uncharacterized protein (TIGR03435 family)